MLIIDCQYYIRTCLLCCSKNWIVKLKSFLVNKQILAIDKKDTRNIILLDIIIII